jgi:hypothetical protein
MDTHEISKLTRRHLLLPTAGILAGSAIGARLAPEWRFAYQRGGAPAGSNPIDQMRAQMAMAPIETVELGDTLKMLKLADARTKIFPGHGPLGDKASLTQYRDMLVTMRDRVRTLKSSGKTADEVVAAKPTADLDATWGKGFLPPDQFVTIVYNTL